MYSTGGPVYMYSRGGHHSLVDLNCKTIDLQKAMFSGRGLGDTPQTDPTLDTNHSLKEEAGVPMNTVLHVWDSLHTRG